MKNNLPINKDKQFKYSITFSSWDEESLEAGQTDDLGFEIKDDVNNIGEILHLANDRYGIYYPLTFGGWESTEPEENTDYFERGINKYYTLHVKNVDGTDISQEENDFITFLLSDGRYEINKFRDYAVGGVVIGAIAVGIGGLIAYYYFNNKKPESSKNSRAKTVVKNGRIFPIKDAWKREHSLENKSEKHEVPQEDRKFEMGGDASEHYHEIEYGEGGVARAKEVITNKIGFNENVADYLVSKSEKFAIWFADSILKEEISIRGEFKKKSDVLKFLNERSNSVNTNYISSNFGSPIREILDWLQHPITPKQDLRNLTFDKALEKAREWHNELQVLGGDIDFVEPTENIIIKRYPKNSDGIEYYWVLIPSNFCSLESSRMGHCGRTGYGNNLISLRSIKPFGEGHIINDSHITIAYGSDGIFYQVKGKKNNKPSEKYFPLIFDLIKTMLIDSENESSIKIPSKYGDAVPLNFQGFGSEYDKEEDYGFEDMSNEEIRELYELEPTIFSDAESIFALFDARVINIEELKEIIDGNQVFNTFGNQMKLYERGIISEEPSTIVEIQKDCGDVKDLLKIDRDYSDDLVVNILCGDIGELYDGWSYYYDNPSDLVGNLNKENEQSVIDEIVRLTGLDESVVKENGIEYYLNGDDDDFSKDDFDNIIRILASAQNSADNSDYYKYLYDAIESALNNLGEVQSLNDEGVKMTIDLSNYMSLEEIGKKMDYYEFSDVEDLFSEIIGSEIDLPNLRIDDRYTPYGSNSDFNEYFADADLESGYEKGGSIRVNKNKKTKIKNMKPSQRKLEKGGALGVSKEDYYLVVKNWVYFTFNYPMGFVKDAFNSNHLESKFNSSYTKYGSIGVLMSFWANLDNENREILSLWVKNNYFSSSSDKSKLLSISDSDYDKIINHWCKFCFNFPYGFIEKVFEDENTSHFEQKWIRAYESVGSIGSVNKFFVELSGNNQEILTDWVYENYKGASLYSNGGETGENKPKRRRLRKTPKIVRTLFEEETFEYAGGGEASDDFIVHGHCTVSNSGGYEIELADSGDSARVRDAYGSDNPEISDWLEIEYVENEDGELDEDGNLELVPVIDPNGYNIPLNLVMRANYKKGGRLSDKATYLGKRDIESIKTVYGQTIAGKKLLDGNYVKGKLNKPTMSRTQFEEETFEYADGGEIDGKKIGVAKRTKIKNWYVKNYPNDDLGEQINDEISFWTLYVLMYQRNEVYSLLEVNDSVVRERVFERLSEILGVDYDYIYKLWLNADKYADGGEVEDWMEEALASLIEETGFDDLEITMVSNDGNEFYATGDDAEYRVFKTEDDAEKFAVEQVIEDLRENPEYFNKDFLMGYIDGRDFFEEALNEMNNSYADDIETESDRKYSNRLIAELVDNGLMDEEDAESDNAEELADGLKDDYVALITEGQLEEGNNGLDYFISNFGEEEAYKMVADNNLIDIDEASKGAVDVDGIAHFISSYDGETLYLSNDYVAYRTN